jgi:hypothetical protein
VLPWPRSPTPTRTCSRVLTAGPLNWLADSFPTNRAKNGLQERKNLAVYDPKSAGRQEETRWAPSGSNRRPAD